MDNIAKEFLIEEYKELNNTLHINEERGEKRLDLFITLSSFVIGVIGFALKDLDLKDVHDNLLRLFYLIMILLLIGLILVGLIILERLRSRNNTTDCLIKDIRRIREIIKNNIDNHPSGSPITLPHDYTAFEKLFKTSRQYGSLNAIAKIIIAVLVGTLSIFIVLISLNDACDQNISHSFDQVNFLLLATISIASFIITLFLLFNLIKDDDVMYTHAGGVVFRKGKDGKEFLIIKSLENNNWVLPKGHIEKCETPKSTAKREVLEETGYLVEPIKMIGKSSFIKDNYEKVNVIYFVMEYVEDSGKRIENRVIDWVTKDKAIELLTFEDAKNIMKKLLL